MILPIPIWLLTEYFYYEIDKTKFRLNLLQQTNFVNYYA